ncbi:MAG: alanine racemase [Erysipelotrichaceae bacterium]|nr:alanine racemase [Erysipelotrichaceae bacterium]MCI6703857.1 alanine racemase [Erysipelotrichaceae bacterium]
MYRDAWIKVDLDAFKYNIKTIIKKTNKNLIAIVKANAYGCGIQEIYKAAEEAGACMFAVSSLEEAIALRNCGCKKDILILSYVSHEYIDIIKKNDLTLTTVSLDWIKTFSKYDASNIKVQIKLDTGMNRIGLKSEEELKEAIKILDNSKMIIEGIFTHFACSDEKENPMTNKQFKLFENTVKNCNRNFKWIHTSNSDGAFILNENFTNAVRVGISLLGINTYDKTLKNVLSLFCRITNVKKILKGETVSYGATYKALENEIIATLPIGYADGWIRKNQGRMVLVEDEYAEIVGRICMDQMMIKLKSKKNIGTLVELFGKNISIEKIANDLDTIPYEIITILSDRLTRVYFKDNRYLTNFNPRLNESEN